MDTSTLLWIDLTTCSAPRVPGLFPIVSAAYSASRVDENVLISETIQTIAPRILCFEYDCPDRGGLDKLRWAKQMFPSLPILMITEYHSEELAVWAFRSGVWDYMVQPVSPDDLTQRITILLRLTVSEEDRDLRTNSKPPQPIPIELRGTSDSWQGKRVLRAVSHIKTHYADKVTLETAARLCGLDRFQFSRAFKEGQGVTFREFLVRYRVDKAAELLKNPRISVTDAALAAGFNDLSHFARMFRRYLGVCASRYHRENGTQSR